MKYEHICYGCFTDDGRGDVYSCNIINDSGDNVGYCKYYKPHYHENDVYIEYIYIYPKHRLKGYASHMAKELNTKYRLMWDNRFTIEGRLWYNAIKRRGIITE